MNLKHKLEELLLEYTLSNLLDAYDPDRVFRFISNSCVLFGLDMVAVQKVILKFLYTQRNHLQIRADIITAGHLLGIPSRLMRRTLRLDDADRHQVYNVKRRPRTLQPPVLTDEERTLACALYYHLHQLGAKLC